MSTDSLAAIVKQMQADGQTQQVVTADGQPTIIELVHKPRITRRQAVSRFIHAILSQNVRNN